MDGYFRAVKYLESFVNYEKLDWYSYKKSLGLQRIKSFLQFIGNPQEELKVIHIAGSKGKGSTCVFVAYILRQAGFSVGLYTSPHLSDFRERIRILKPRQSNSQLPFEGSISKEYLTGLVEFLKPVIKGFEKFSIHNRHFHYGRLSFFEVYTALAFLYFKEKKVDFVVMETGMGGRLDATNVAQSLVCAITPISYEHTRYLGKTLTQIAGEKAGIIKQKSLVISSIQKKEAAQVIQNKSASLQAKLFTVGKDIKYSTKGKYFSIKGINNNYTNLRINLLGRHQLINASQAVGIIEALGSYGFKVSVNCIKKGLYNTLWPGRLEVLCRKPCIVVDGAQNAASAAVLKSAVTSIFKYKKLILVFGVSQDKDIKGMVSQLSGLAHKIILTCADNPRAALPKYLKRYFSAKEKEIFITAGVREAKVLALKVANLQDLILVTGSLFVVGEFRDAYR
ncbi:MAG: bifunctional folylpolyglutamate synthase/dihydrofolate synthase [Candidatus Omnitrophica bacterium]|nr:bifunctional folylpolyglutamate synthase/dihydrofolate synthase [Candidatus Omnitrophota bacterium]MBU1923241.1 bifunctional folylpolyglutamate synthase/dihydrofolate synthase [Candidatus Omnitrophota bacterium]